MKNQEGPRVFATVTGEGKAQADVDFAVFHVEITKKHDVAATAKAGMRKAVKALERRLTTLRKKGMVVEENSEATSLNEGPYTKRDKDGKKEGEGFEVRYSLDFASSSLDLVSEIRRALSDPRDQDVSVQTPRFSLRDTKKKALRHEAQQAAAADAQDIFAGECEGFDLKADDYKPLTMQYGYDASRSQRLERMSESDDPIQIKHRMAVVVVTVRVEYVKKTRTKS